LNPEKPDIVVQDKAPPGGYPPIRYRAALAQPFFPTWSLVLAYIAVTSYGFYKLKEQYNKTLAEKEDRKRRRIAILPYLMAEANAIKLSQTYKMQLADKNVSSNNPVKLYVITGGNKPIYETRDEKFMDIVKD